MMQPPRVPEITGNGFQSPIIYKPEKTEELSIPTAYPPRLAIKGNKKKRRNEKSSATTKNWLKNRSLNDTAV